MFGASLPVGVAISLASGTIALALLYRLSRLDLNQSQSRLGVSAALLAVFSGLWGTWAFVA